MDDLREAIERLTVSLNKIDGLYYMGAKKLGVKDSALSILYVLNDGKSHSQKQISDEWLIPKTTVNTIIREWRREGLVVLSPEEHGREKTVSLTEKGREQAEAILAPLNHAEQTAMEKTIREFSPEFITVLEHFCRHLQQEFEQRIFSGSGDPTQ